MYTIWTFDIGVGSKSPTCVISNPNKICTQCPNNGLFEVLEPPSPCKEENM